MNDPRHNPYSPPEAKLEDQAPPAPEGPVGLGGWLILVGIGVVVTPFRILLETWPIYSGILTNGTWEKLTQPDSETYHPMWQPVLVAEMTVNAAMLLTWLFLNFLFFTKRRLFPKLHMAALVFTLTYMVVDALLIQPMLPPMGGQVDDAELVKQISKSFFSVMIWVPYMLWSKRVKTTFVN